MLGKIDVIDDKNSTRDSNAGARNMRIRRQLQSDSMNNILSDRKRFGNNNKKENNNNNAGGSFDKDGSSYNPKLRMEWYVGGAHRVEKTFLAWHSIPDVGNNVVNPSNWKAYLSSPSFEDHVLDNLLQTGSNSNNGPILASPIFSGKSRWFTSDDHMHFDGFDEHSLSASGSLFSHQIDFTNESDPAVGMLSSGRYWLVAWTVVDQDFGAENQGYPANSSPQSYYSNIRTKSGFTCENIGDRECHGKRYWPSDYVEVEVHNNLNKRELGKRGAGGGNLETFVKIIDSVKHCAWWEYQSVKSRKSIPKSVHSKDISETNHEIALEVQESFLFLNFERGYIILFLTVLFFICVISMIASYWRRLRVYTTVLNNRYLNLPTGFVRV